MSKKVLVIGDLHCGSMSGLTPPNYIVSKGRNEFFSKLQEDMWKNYIEILKEFGTVDVLVVNGDVIDGKGHRSGGTELLAPDLLEQTDIAIEALSYIKAKSMFFTYGTPYHTTSKSGEDFDKIVANAFNATIHDELNLKVENVLFNIKHKVDSSSSPYNRAMPVGKHRLWDALQSLRTEDECPAVYLRSHVHYFSFCGESNWTAFTLPALQANQTKYGSRQCSGITDWGMCLFTVDDDVLTGWNCRMVDLMSNKKKIIKL